MTVTKNIYRTSFCSLIKKQCLQLNFLARNGKLKIQVIYFCNQFKTKKQTSLKPRESGAIWSCGATRTRTCSRQSKKDKNF